MRGDSRLPPPPPPLFSIPFRPPPALACGDVTPIPARSLQATASVPLREAGWDPYALRPRIAAARELAVAFKRAFMAVRGREADQIAGDMSAPMPQTKAVPSCAQEFMRAVAACSAALPLDLERRDGGDGGRESGGRRRGGGRAEKRRTPAGRRACHGFESS